MREAAWEHFRFFHQDSAILRSRQCFSSAEQTACRLGAKNQLGFGLSPLEERRPDCLFHDRFTLPAAAGQSCKTTVSSDLGERSNGLTLALARLRIRVFI